jgi:predicted RNase H-like HicB family nuclease
VKKYTYAISIKREGGEYYAYSEDFPGVYGRGKTIDEARVSIVESMKLHIAESRSPAHRRDFRT